MSHTTRDDELLEDRCDCDSMTPIPFLDTSCSIIECRLDTDLFKRERDKNQYLLPSSYHPAQAKKAIHFGLSMRIIRICRDPEKGDQKLQDIRKQLINWGYPSVFLDSVIERAWQIPRKEALRRVNRQKKSRALYLHTHMTQGSPQWPRSRQGIGEPWCIKTHI